MTYSGKALTGWENAQTEGQQDPAAKVAVAIVVLLQLLADLTVNLVSGQITVLIVENKKKQQRTSRFCPHLRGYF